MKISYKKLHYITRVDLGSNSAQSHQIKCMARSFSKLMSNDFLISAFTMQSLKIEGKNELGKLINKQVSVALYTLSKSLFGVNTLFYTRDIIVAFCAVITGSHGIYEMHSALNGVVPRIIFRLLIRSPNFKIVVISKALMEYIVNHFSCDPEKITIAHDAVEISEFEEVRLLDKELLRCELGLPKNKKIILHTGSLYKGGAEHFGTCASIATECLFVHVGGGEKECEFWREHYLSCGIQNIEFRSHVNHLIIKKYQHVADILFYITTRSSDIYWCTSPLKLFEYMASLKPIIASNIGSISEIIDEETAFCFDPDVIGSLERATKDCLYNIRSYEKRIQRNYEKILAEYNWDARVQKILKGS